MERTTFLRTKAVMETCHSHLEDSQTWNTEIESFLTQHILIIMCAEIQQEIYYALEVRAHLNGDSELKDFAVASGKKILRSVAKKDIANFVGMFGARAKAHLNENIEDHEVTLYNNAVTKRHDVAHNTGTNITFRELQEILRSAEKLIIAMGDAISLRQ
ncbi:HEPN domain-containing protein [Serratia rubidaea]|uniref:HEPN domain-containing protein n=1 Tax=Serratia rubidaea TaxID=61652 RepID=UPI00234A2AB4|nr:HEPN domain-containing protein [Serratia rubidaea]MDC6120859.1 HEPN domain-containing protein [Serratia rubidaea]